MSSDIFTQRSRLDGRVAVVVGGAGRLGRTCCNTLAGLGATVVCADVTAPAQDHFGDAVHPFLLDLLDDEAIESAPAAWVDQYGGLDILVHAAAMVGTSEDLGWVVPFAEQSVKTWRKALDVNLTSLFSLSQAARPHLAGSGVGSIIAFSSIYGLWGPDHRLYEGTPMGNPAAYAASKGGVLQLVRWLATTLAPDVRVNAISPGGVFAGQPEAFVSRYCEKTPLERMAEPEDLIGAVGFLAGDLSSYVTGQNLIVDGGWGVW